MKPADVDRFLGYVEKSDGCWRTVNPTDWRAANNPKAKLTRERVAIIRARLAVGERPVDLAREFCVTRARVSQLRRGGFE